MTKRITNEEYDKLALENQISTLVSKFIMTYPKSKVTDVNITLSDCDSMNGVNTCVKTSVTITKK